MKRWSIPSVIVLAAIGSGAGAGNPGESEAARPDAAVAGVVLTDEPAADEHAVPTSPNDHASLLNLTFTPLIWLPSFNGTTGVGGVDFDIDATFIDILDESETVFGIQGAIDAEYKRWVFQLNGVYTTATFNGSRGRARSGPGGGGVDVRADGELETDALWFEAFAGYRFVDTPIVKDDPASKSRFILDAFIGGRVTTIDVEASVRVDASVTLPDGRVLEAGRSNGIDDTEGWFEPFVGARTVLELGEHWNLTLRGDVGGFGVDDSEFSWQAIGAIGYQIRQDGWVLNLFAGYRALGQDYERDGFTWDVIVHGPVLGAQFVLSF